MLTVGDMKFLDHDFTMQGGSGSRLVAGESLINGSMLTVTGNATDWQVGQELSVGRLASGLLEIENGATVGHGGIFLGQETFSEGMVNLQGADTVMGSAALASMGRIGILGTGTINVREGARSDMSSAVLGEVQGGSGIVNVDGMDSEFRTHGYDIWVGGLGTGQLNVTNGG